MAWWRRLSLFWKTVVVVLLLEVASLAINWPSQGNPFASMRVGQIIGTILGQFILFPALCGALVVGIERLARRMRA